MVIQQNSDFKLWGKAKPDTKVTVKTSWSKEKTETRSDSDGNWSVSVPTPAASYESQSITISDGDPLTLSNILTGDVWICSGQSNMEMPLERSRDGAQAIQDSGNPRLHFCTVPKTAWDPPEELSWHMVEPGTAGSLSAVAYYAGRTLTEHLEGVHVGVIVCCWGATYAHCWTSRSALERFPEGRARIGRYEDRIAGKYL